MYINDNIAALDSWRNLTNTQNSMALSLQRLSSGLRINKAADDAAGLAISQKMLAQINGLDQAARNSQDGISLVQTAEGALGQTQQILQRMRQLAVEASSDTSTTSDRANLQLEMNQLAKELTDISNHTQFNNKRLLTGQFGSSATAITIQTGANSGENLSVSISAADAKTLAVSRDLADTVVRTAGTATATDNKAGVTDTATATSATVATTANSYNLDIGTGAYKLQWNLTYDSTGKVTAGTVQLQDSTGKAIGTAVNLFNGSTALTSVNVGDASTGRELALSSIALSTVTVGTGSTGGTVAQTDTLDTSATLAADKSTSGTSTNGWTASAAAGLLIMSQASANSAITTIDAALNTVSAQRANLGAIQNRLQYNVSNVQLAAQNLTDAKSRITDVDMAREMANFTKDQILQQAGVAMLAQANSMPQAVLKLLG